jgi:RHS repeat-associated protein
MDNIVDYFRSEIVNASDYTPFGVQMDGRKFVVDDYRYGFNDKENDPEVVGTGNGTQDYGMRIYNPSLGRFLSVDPLTRKFPMLTPYQFSSNRPIDCIDLDGLESVHYSSFFQSRLGGKMIMQVFTASGLRKEVEESFATQVGLSTQKYDLYYVFIPDNYYKGSSSDAHYGFTVGYSTYEEMRIANEDKAGFRPLSFLYQQGMWPQVKQSFADGKQVQLVVLNQDWLDIMSENFGNGEELKSVTKRMTLTMYHEYKLHVEDNINGNMRSTIEDHEYGFGSDYNDSYNLNNTSPSYDDIKDMSSVMGIAKGKIEYVFDQAKKQQAAQQQKVQEEQKPQEERK